MKGKSAMTEKKNTNNSISQLKYRHVGALLFMFVLIGALSFYFTDGYVRIGEDKYDAFIRIVPLGLSAWIVLALLDMLRSKGGFKNIVDWIRLLFGGRQGLFVGLFSISAVVSTMTSEYRGVSVNGNAGWHMGMKVLLLIVCLYLISADFFLYSQQIYHKILVWGIMCISAPVFILGILNRYSIYPLEMYGKHEDYISTLGNINWYCGYWSIWMALGCGLFMFSKTTKERIFSGIYLVLSTIAGITCGASSAYLALGAIWLAGGMITGINKEKVEMYVYMIIVQAHALPIIRIIGLFRVNRMWYDSSLLRKLTFSNIGIVIWICVCCICAIFLKIILPLSEKRKRETHKEEQSGGWIIGIIVGAGLAIIGIIILNTTIRGGIWPFRGIGILTFNDNWGNGRGLIWRISFEVIKNTPPIRMLFGVGCDCFCSYTYTIEAIAIEIYRKWGSLILTNAHNEGLTMFINQGIFGFVSYMGILFSHLFPIYGKIQLANENGMTNSVLCAGIFAVAAYMAIGFVGFMHILSTPFIFIVMGAVAGLIKRDTLNIMN